MTHEEIIKEFMRIRKYLQSRAKDIKARHGEKPDFANEMDEWHYEILMQLYKVIQEHECVNSVNGTYLSVDVRHPSGLGFGCGIEI